MASDESPLASNGAEINHLMRASTRDSIAVPRELLEKIYLNPPQTVKGGLRRTFANPTPLPVVGLALSALPLGCDLMGWRGAGGQGAASIPVYIFLGGVVQIIGAIMEWILGNTFSFEVFGVLGGFFLAFGCTLLPELNAAASYSPNGSYVQGLMSSSFAASFGFFLVAMAITSFVFFICAFRTNVVFVIGLFTLTLAFCFVAALWWLTAIGNMAQAAKVQKGTGALVFVLSIIAFYLFTALTLQAVVFPFQNPVGDLSWMPSQTSRQEKKAQRNAYDEA